MFSAAPTQGTGAPGRADGLHGEAVRERNVMAGLVQLRCRQLEAGRVDAPAIAEIHEAPDLVHGEDVLDAIGQTLGNVGGVIGKGF